MLKNVRNSSGHSFYIIPHGTLQAHGNRIWGNFWAGSDYEVYNRAAMLKKDALL